MAKALQQQRRIRIGRERVLSTRAPYSGGGRWLALSERERREAPAQLRADRRAPRMSVGALCYCVDPTCSAASGSLRCILATTDRVILPLPNITSIDIVLLVDS